MADNRVIVKKSSVASQVPTSSDLVYGELAVNYTDGRIYFKDSSNNIDFFEQVNSFQNIDVSGQTTLTADGGSDTLTFVEGDGISITTDGATNKVTIEASGSSGNDFVDSASFNTTNGKLTLTRTDNGTVVVDLDGRYLQSYTETDTLDSVTDRGSSTTNNISVGSLTTTADSTINGLTVGHGGSDKDSNVAVGVDALQLNANFGVSNVAVGDSALKNNTDGSFNVAVGSLSLFDNDSGNSNTAVGFNSLGNNISGFRNTATGSQALFHNTTGDFNVAVGDKALFLNTTDSKNIAIGYESLRNTDGGARNTMVGHESGQGITTGNDNVAIGYRAGDSLGSVSGTTLIGSDMRGTGIASNTVAIGAGGTERLRINSSGDVGIGTTSPSSKLEVDGTVTATSFSGDGSNLTGINTDETDTLDSVTDRGASTTNDISTGQVTSSGTVESAGLFAHPATINYSYTLESGNNAMSAGPISVGAGSTITVEDGARWVVI